MSKEHDNEAVDGESIQHTSLQVATLGLVGEDLRYKVDRCRRMRRALTHPFELVDSGGYA